MDWNFDFPAGTEERPLRHGRLFAMPGARLLLIHGGFHGAWCWAPFLRFLSAHGVAAAAIDLRGHGGLAQSPDYCNAGVKEMAEDVVEAAAALGGEVLLAGHSLGALVAMAAAARVRPRGMILVAPQPPAHVGNVRLLPPFLGKELVPPPPEGRARKWLFAGAEGDLAPYLERLCPESPAFLNDLYARRVTVEPGALPGPVLCLSGAADDSPLHGMGQDRAIAAFFGAELVTVTGASHCLMADATRDRGAAEIVAWLMRNKLC